MNNSMELGGGRLSKFSAPPPPARTSGDLNLRYLLLPPPPSQAGVELEELARALPVQPFSPPIETLVYRL